MESICLFFVVGVGLLLLFFYYLSLGQSIVCRVDEPHPRVHWIIFFCTQHSCAWIIYLFHLFLLFSSNFAAFCCYYWFGFCCCCRFTFFPFKINEHTILYACESHRSMSFILPYFSSLNCAAVGVGVYFCLCMFLCLLVLILLLSTFVKIKIRKIFFSISCMLCICVSVLYCVWCVTFDVYCVVLCFSRIRFFFLSRRDECIFSFARLKNRIDFDEVCMMCAVLIL